MRSTVRLLLGMLAACVALVAAAAAVAPASSDAAACKPGVRTVDGSPARVFCGPAKAVVKTGGKTLTFAGGACERSGGRYVVNIGTFFAGSSKSKRPYFGLLIDKPKPGTYRSQTLSFRSGGVGSSVFATVTLETLKRGSFSGDVFGGSRVTGTFAC